MTHVLLLRHASHDWLSRGIAGRLPCVGLNAQGQREAGELAARLRATAIDAVYCSPQQRARETVAPLAHERRLAVRREDAFDEIDFGEWTGLSFARLRADEVRWRQWIEQRSIAAPPGGESFAQVQQRAMAGIDRLARLHPAGSVLVVSHGDVIKAVLADILGLSLDHMERFEIAPSSLSAVAIGPGWRQVKLVNGLA
jgi:broad specificity phosphatase PhoE